LSQSELCKIMGSFLQKIFGNEVVEDIPFPEVIPHTHDGQDSPMLAPSSIDTVQIKAGAINTLSLADNSVSSEKIIDQAVLTEHLNALAVTEQKLAVAAVATDKIKNGAVNAQKLIQSEAVITVSAQIGEAIVQSAHIGVGVILNAHLGNAIVTTAKIQDLAVEWAKIGSLAVGNSKIMDLAVSTGKIQDLSVSAAKIQDLAVSSAKIDNLAVTEAKIADLAVTNAKIASLAAGKVTAGQFNLTSTGYMSCPYGGIKIGYLGQVGGVGMYGIAANIGHGIMLNAGGSDGYSRLWIDDSANKPLCMDFNAKDRFFIKASSGNDVVRFYGDNAWAGGFIDMLVPFRPVVRSASEPSDPVQGEIYYDSNPGQGGAGGRLKIWNGYSWHIVAWLDDIV